MVKTISYMTHLYSKLAYVEALHYLGRTSMEIQHALYIEGYGLKVLQTPHRT